MAVIAILFMTISLSAQASKPAYMWFTPRIVYYKGLATAPKPKKTPWEVAHNYCKGRGFDQADEFRKVSKNLVEDSRKIRILITAVKCSKIRFAKRG